MVKKYEKPTPHQCKTSAKTVKKPGSKRAKKTAGRTLAKCRWGKYY